MAELDTQVVETEETAETATKNPEVAKLKAELARQKAATDKATAEAAESKRLLRAKQSAEEAAAAEAREAQEARDKELAELRKRFAVSESSKKIMSFVGDEQTASAIAESLYGAEDAGAVLNAFQKAWTAKEKALRLEFGRIPPPGIGGTDGATVTREQLDSMSYMQRVEFATKNPEDYQRIMGRN